MDTFALGVVRKMKFSKFKWYTTISNRYYVCGCLHTEIFPPLLLIWISKSKWLVSRLLLIRVSSWAFAVIIIFAHYYAPFINQIAEIMKLENACTYLSLIYFLCFMHSIAKSHVKVKHTRNSLNMHNAEDVCKCKYPPVITLFYLIKWKTIRIIMNNEKAEVRRRDGERKKENEI